MADAVKYKKISAKTLVEQRESELSHAERVTKALDLQYQIKQMTAELDNIKKYYVDLFNKMNIDKTTHEIVTKEGSVKISETNSYGIENELIPNLKRIFEAETFDAYVTTKINYTPTQALKNLLSDGDYKHKDIIREAVTIKQSYGVKFTPISKVTHEDAKPKRAKLIKVKPEPKQDDNSLI